MKIVADKHIPFVETYFSQGNELVLLPGRAMTASDVKDADILLVRSVTRVDEALLKGSSVKWVGSVTAGCDHVDTAWLASAGIRYTFASGFNAPPVADYVVSVVAAMQKKRLLPTENVKAAVIGVGRVGRLVEKHLSVLGFDVQCCDPLRAVEEKDFVTTPIDSIENVDLICLHVPLTKEGKHPTHQFIEQGFLARQKPGCILLNASRGGVIHADELLNHGQALSWCFDVWENEPDINTTILDQAVISTPHIAGYSVQSKCRGTQMIFQAACEQGFIASETVNLPEMSKQILSFAGSAHRWQDIVLGIFNPVLMTAMMKSLIFAADEVGQVFDQMRHDFNYRNEFAFTEAVLDGIAEDQAAILSGLGIEVRL